MTIFLSCKHYFILVLARWRRCFVDAHQTSAKGCTGFLQPGEHLIHAKIFQKYLQYLCHGTILIFAHSPGTIFSAAWSRENQTRPLNCPSIASSYHSFPTQRGRFQTTGFKNTYSYMFLVFQVTARRGDYRPLPPSLVTRSTKLKNPSEQPPKNQGAGGRKEQFLKIDCSIGRDQHTWVFWCDR